MARKTIKEKPTNRKTKLQTKEDLEYANFLYSMLEFIVGKCKNPKMRHICFNQVKAALDPYIFTYEEINNLNNLVKEKTIWTKHIGTHKKLNKFDVSVKFNTENDKKYTSIKYPSKLSKKNAIQAYSAAKNNFYILESISGERTKEFRKRMLGISNDNIERDKRIHLHFKKRRKSGEKYESVIEALAKEEHLAEETIKGIIRLQNKMMLNQ
jgi:hypothetical protein